LGYFIALVIAVGFGVPVAVIGGGLGQGKAAAAALEGIARQPEAAGKIQTAMIIGLALIESLVIYALVLGLILMLKLPDTATMLKLVSK
jgi:F-type H+-transporting ATPase subunit c